MPTVPECANVHLDAVEHGHRIVFLHALEGPAGQATASGSPLAGIPGRSDPRFKRRLRALEGRGDRRRPAGRASSPPWLPEAGGRAAVAPGAQRARADIDPIH